MNPHQLDAELLCYKLKIYFISFRIFVGNTSINMQIQVLSRMRCICCDDYPAEIRLGCISERQKVLDAIALSSRTRTQVLKLQTRALGFIIHRLARTVSYLASYSYS